MRAADTAYVPTTLARRLRWKPALNAALLLACIALLNALAQDAIATIQIVTRALGAENLGSIRLSGCASTVPFGQTYTANGPWTGNPIVDYVKVIDLAQLSSRTAGTRLSNTSLRMPVSFDRTCKILPFSERRLPGKAQSLSLLNKEISDVIK